MDQLLILGATIGADYTLCSCEEAHVEERLEWTCEACKELNRDPVACDRCGYPAASNDTQGTRRVLQMLSGETWSALSAEKQKREEEGHG